MANYLSDWLIDWRTDYLTERLIGLTRMAILYEKKKKKSGAEYEELLKKWKWYFEVEKQIAQPKYFCLTEDLLGLVLIPMIIKYQSTRITAFHLFFFFLFICCSFIYRPVQRPSYLLLSSPSLVELSDVGQRLSY